MSCETLILLALIDGLYLLSINRRLRETFHWQD